MKFRITFKDPDALLDCIENTISEMDFGTLSEVEVAAVREIRKEELLKKCAKWFEYKEYLTIEIDTEQDTAVVVPVTDY